MTLAEPHSRTWDVVIVGAGPTGLFLANLLGKHGLRVAVVEKEQRLIDYPRGVSIDDETLRVLQQIGVIDEAMAFIVPNQRIEYVTAKGRRLGGYAPTRADFGWPAKSGFIQPAIDGLLASNLGQHPTVQLLMGYDVTSLHDCGDDVEVGMHTPAGDPMELRAKFVVGCDGGRSATRKQLGVRMQGSSETRRWLVMDLRNDPIGRPNVTVFCDPHRPVVWIGLPQGIRRLEFMLFDGECDEELDEDVATRLAAPYVPELNPKDIIRTRVYKHHSLVAENFAVGRILIAGDAAHLMPVWQGQGYNSGVRDAANLALKLALVIKSNANPNLVQTYDEERRPHAASMVNLSRITGRYLGMTNPALAWVRNATTLAGGAVPTVRDYFMQMRFKPMPRYNGTAVVREPSEKVGAAVGGLFVQPHVLVSTDRLPQLLDDVIGDGFGILRWGTDPRSALTTKTLDVFDNIGAKFITVLPMGQWQRSAAWADSPRSLPIGDSSGALRMWFDQNPSPFVVIRPDRIVAVACQPQTANARCRELMQGLGLRP